MSAESARTQGSSTESARQPPESYKKGKRTLFNVHSRINSDENASTPLNIVIAEHKQFFSELYHSSETLQSKYGLHQTNGEEEER